MKLKKIKLDAQKFQNPLKDFDYRSLKKYASPQATEDLNAFLEKLPQHSGQTMLIIAGVAWAMAGAVGLFTAVQLQTMAEIRIELEEAEALKPIVPKVVNRPVSSKQVSEFSENAKDIYKGLEFRASGSKITMNAKTLSSFGQFREAIAHTQNGGQGWRVEVNKLCVGRECDRYPLAASLTINTVSVK
ncbi:MAG: hypothetical protein AB8B83_04670 [Bdellovibrionales bacterium]